MKNLARMLMIMGFAFGMFHAAPASATATENFCFKLGDYYDPAGTGYHVVDCYNYLGNDQWLFERYYIKHGTPFHIVWESQT